MGTWSKFVVAIVAACLAAAASAQSKAPINIRLGWQPTMNGARYFIAAAEKLFEKEGLTLTLTKFTAGPPYFAAFQSDSIDIGFLGWQPAATGIAQGIPIKVVAIENDAGGAEGLVVRADSGIKSLADLKGKSVATRRGSSAHTALLRGLEFAKIPQSEVRIVDIDVTALIPAFTKGDVPAAWYWEPWMGLLKRNGGTLIVTDREVGFPVGILWAATDKWLKANPEAMQRFLAVLDAAQARIKQNPKQAAASVAKQLELTEEHVLEVFTKGASWPTNRESLAPSYPYTMDPASIAAGKGIAGVMAENAAFQKSVGIIQNVPDYKQAIDSSHLVRYSKGK